MTGKATMAVCTAVLALCGCSGEPSAEEIAALQTLETRVAALERVRDGLHARVAHAGAGSVREHQRGDGIIGTLPHACSRAQLGLRKMKNA